MTAMSKDKNRAIKLRKKGLSYSEILKEVPAAKSTLSLWLRNVGLAKRQRQKLTEKKRLAQIKGAQVRHNQRIERSRIITNRAFQEIGEITERELKLIGAALYWAEGSKQKEHNVSEQVMFSNSDPLMISVFLRWLVNICRISKQDLNYDLYIHESGKVKNAKNFWSKRLGIMDNLLRVYFKKHIITRRRNVGENYKGLIRIRVKRSTDLNRKIEGWIEGIYQNCGVV